LPDLVAQGVSTVEGTLRGPLADPLFSGRVELKGASFFLKDVANGLENVNGVLFFDRSRARLDRLRAQSGGGQLALSGFVGLAGDELTYQLTASADRVRVRYPEGISTLINATLNLTGSPARSVLGGTVTILRSGVTPRTDIASLLADAGRASVATPAAIDNEFLRNLQFDVRFETAQNAELSTMLTRNVQADLDLRLRGTPSNPALLGRASITQGELTFFGTRYDISRAEINFFNPTRIEPVINMDLETRLRGVLVTVTFSGPLNRLNLSYRSDPPLQSNDILALLTVGRSPDSTQPVIAPSTTTVQNSTFLQGSGAGLISSAAMSAVTGRMQRFFGVSRVRIDPLLTGIDRTPQARLTVEQQVSSDIIVTYITNLNRTQQQIVSVEWDFSRQFSAIAVRDENGTFGVDFFYRRRFK
ncbi:MAG: translocation/assembly module TamB, partial [Bryobacter sp.]|nr:translocation/assembly module TamB [Bryobacter sp.]